MFKPSFVACSVAMACVCLLMVRTVDGQGPQPGPSTFPEGPGREVVQSVCAACHEAELITGSAGFTEAGWRDLIGTMVRLPDPQLAVVAKYLGTHFPQTTALRPTLVPGPAKVSFQEWVVPTLGQLPRDPFQMEDGTIWWAGQWGSIIGRLDPRTGAMKEFQLARDARPHSIVADTAGDIWYTGNGNATVGRLDPDSGEITVFPMPDPAARDPHTPVFDKAGNLWFTLQNSHMVGRLTPATGDIKLVTVPTAGARPYGMKLNSQGIPWVAYRGANKLASLDPVTMAVTEHPLPHADSRVRRLDIASDDTVWYVDYGRGALGRMNPRSGEVKEWPSPSGPESHPYAIAIVDDVVWYNESHQRPDALVRFDPATERFQSWAIPSGVGIIRHMTVSPDGNLVIHQSSTNRVGLVTIEDD